MYYSQLIGKDSRAVSFGPERCVPPSFVRGLSSQVTYFEDMRSTVAGDSIFSESSVRHDRPNSANDIAVVGMSCNVAGADDLEGFWEIIQEGKSQHVEVPCDRFGFETIFRETESKGSKWYGNFIKDFDAFDHKFFKKTPREAASMDPQQRLLLQAAYQAVEQSGYFRPGQSQADRQIGCYIGVCATDYENNIACHAPNAFSATGNLRSFIAGKVSHYFGWTGPGLTVDTACSASAVAIHQACMAILNGECVSALAGGTNMITQPLWFQNLAAASFLSPSGQCKPFDAQADGYCRGEAVATVFLKRLSSALANGDQIIGTISGTAVYQNQNCTPIFVPNAPSLSDLFRNVLHKSGIKPEQVSVVEAHGTGTPVGDPAEYESIRRVFGNLPRALRFGSIKGLVGHTEGTSGVVSLIKVLLMMQQGYIPPQASFSKMNPAIDVSPSDNMEVTTALRPWDDDYRAALINNYGASGSNASLVVTQAPRQIEQAPREPSMGSLKYPFWFSGLDDRSLRAYATKLRQLIKTKTASSMGISIADLSFNVSRQSNRNLERALIFCSQSVAELDQKLTAFEAGEINNSIATKQSRPVIFCFGGQISTSIGLDRQLFSEIRVLRSHLDHCNAVCESLGASSIYPGIFQKEPVSDPVELQTMLFAVQFASAKSWIDCGIQPSAVVGHSFGELTALCISGVLTLDDALKMVIRRATIIKNSWGDDKGAMLAIEANYDEVKKLLADSESLCTGTPANIACHNGPRSFTLAGSVQSTDAVAQTILTNPAYASMLSKRLNVTHAYHSDLVEPLIPDLQLAGQDLIFNEPKIQMERATELTASQLSTNFVAEHMRDPVYFNHAVQRLAKQYPSSVWLEVSSNATITSMASRALGSPKDCHFQPVSLSSGQAVQQLIDTTINLWRAGLNVMSWLHAPQQTYSYATLLLPPYQFDKQRHWMDFKKPPQTVADGIKQKSPQEEIPKTLFTFVGYQDSSQQRPRFRVNTMIKKFDDIILGHKIAQTAPICPATLQVDMAIEALVGLHPDFLASGFLPQIRNVVNQAPICVNPARTVWLEFEAVAADKFAWHWQVTSEGGQKAASITHTTGDLAFRSVDDAQYQFEFARYERLTKYRRCLEVLDSNEADDIVQGTAIYKLFSDVVDYGESFLGLRKLVGKGNESAGRVVKKHSGETWLDPFLGDCFSQVGGIWVNCLAGNNPGDMFIANGFEEWVRSPSMAKDKNYRQPVEWHVLAHHDRAPSGNSFLTDIFVFDPTTGGLSDAILGINYTRVPKLSMSKLLSKLTGGAAVLKAPETALSAQEPVSELSPAHLSETKARNNSDKRSAGETVEKLKNVLAEISGLEISEIKDDIELADIGIDSLLGMEMAREVEGVFNCTLSTDDLMHVTNFQGLLRCLRSSLGEADESSDSEESSSDEKGSYEDQADCPTPASSVDAGSASPNPASAAEIRKGHADSIKLPASTVLAAFGESKAITDEFIRDYRCSGYLESVMPRQTQLCVALTAEAFKQLGCDLKLARPGQRMEKIPHLPEHTRLAEYLYRMLEETRIVDIDNSCITRTAVALPSKPSATILHELVRDYPDHNFANQLSHWTGSNLADVLTGKVDGIKLIFASEKGKELVSGLYGDSLLNKLAYKQMEDFLSRLVSKLPKKEGTLKILEMGAGTGGTTKWLVPLLASLDVSVEYTFTDLSSSFVAGARKRFKEYSFMKFRVHDIEKPPAEQDLFHSQHVVIASNAVHATHSLTESAKNIHKFLRPDGFLMMLEMTETLYWVDMIFGILEGWWLFEDGRKHAIAHESRWDRDLKASGFGHVDWTDGVSPELKVQRIFVALVSGPSLDRLPAASLPEPQPANYTTRRAATDELIQKYARGFSAPTFSRTTTNPSNSCVLVTGATGSLGAHLVGYLASLPNVDSVVCLNRRNATEPRRRQQDSLESKSVSFEDRALLKLQVFESDIAKPSLGLPQDQYEGLCNRVTHIIHNAWPMNGKLPLKGFTLQFQAMRNLIDLARDISCHRGKGFKAGFQLVSSIATVGLYPLRPNVPEERVTVESVLPNGYGDAKFVCERLLDETLHRYPDNFRTMAVRLGQVAGSKTSGYWNHMEHFAFMIKSAQTLRALPDFDGVLSWTPVNDVAAALGELLVSDTQPYPIYHIDNPVRQPWREMIPVLAEALDIPRDRVVPFSEWIRRVKAFPGAVEWDNPAAKLVEFLEQEFERMSCGGVLLDTAKSREHSATMRGVEPVSAEVARRYVDAWRDSGFLHPRV